MHNRPRFYKGWGLLGLMLVTEPIFSDVSTLAPNFPGGPNYSQTEDSLPNRESLIPSTFEEVSFSILMALPTFYKTPYDPGSRSFSDFFLFSIPLSKLQEALFLHLELGPGFSFSKVATETSDSKQSHLYLTVPVRLRTIYSISRKLHLEGFLGLTLRPIEYFSGPLTRTEFFPKSQWATADAGIGIDVNLTPPLKTRLLLSYSFISVGLELTW